MNAFKLHGFYRILGQNQFNLYRFYLMFFCGAIKLTGPFVTMVFKMVTGDMFTFSIIYGIMLLGFSQAFFFIIKNHEEAENFENYHTTWIGGQRMMMIMIRQRCLRITTSKHMDTWAERHLWGIMW